MSDLLAERPDDGKGRKVRNIQITIDRQKFKLPEQALTAEVLRTLTEPDTGPDRDLYLEGKGKADDLLVGAGQVVELKDGMHFFTAPASIQPGNAA